MHGFELGWFFLVFPLNILENSPRYFAYRIGLRWYCHSHGKLSIVYVFTRLNFSSCDLAQGKYESNVYIGTFFSEYTYINVTSCKAYNMNYLLYCNLKDQQHTQGLFIKQNLRYCENKTSYVLGAWS